MALPARKDIRLKSYDYSQNAAYFVTVCTKDRRNIFSRIRRGDPCGRPQITLLPLGEIAKDCLAETEARYGAVIDHYVLMPDHIHIILRLEGERAGTSPAPTLGQVVGAFKSLVVYRGKQAGLPVSDLWQRLYYDHVIRSREDYLETWNYIDGNPGRYLEKRENPL